MVFFDQNTPAGEWRAQARCCEEQNIALHRNIAFALAVADLLQLPDNLPLMPGVATHAAAGPFDEHGQTGIRQCPETELKLAGFPSSFTTHKGERDRDSLHSI